MTDEESIRWKNPEHRRLRILLFTLRRVVRLARRNAAGPAKEEGIHNIRRLFRYLFERQPAAIHQPDAAEFHVFDIMAGNAGYDRPVPRIGIVGGHVADADPLHGTNCRPFRRAQAASQADEDGGVRYVAHGYVRNRYILDVGAVHALEREAARGIEDDVRDRDVAEIALRLRSDLDPPSWAIAIGRALHGALVRSIQQRANLE